VCCQIVAVVCVDYNNDVWIAVWHAGSPWWSTHNVLLYCPAPKLIARVVAANTTMGSNGTLPG
jgi:hypothetical protein